MTSENTFNLKDVSLYAEKAHADQFDKGGQPYFNHLLRVSNNTIEFLNDVPDEILSPEDRNEAVILAICHDLFRRYANTEDERMQRENDLRAFGATERFIDRLNMLSRIGKFKEMTYMDWIKNLSEKGDLVTIIVKMSDNKDNNDPVRIAQLPLEQQSISNRYNRAYKILKQAYDNIVNHK